MKKLLLAALVSFAALGSLATAADAQRVVIQTGPPPGWVGPHYYWQGQHYHSRHWVCGLHYGHRVCAWRYS